MPHFHPFPLHIHFHMDFHSTEGLYWLLGVRLISVLGSDSVWGFGYNRLRNLIRYSTRLSSEIGSGSARLISAWLTLARKFLHIVYKSSHIVYIYIVCVLLHGRKKCETKTARIANAYLSENHGRKKWQTKIRLMKEFLEPMEVVHAHFFCLQAAMNVN